MKNKNNARFVEKRALMNYSMVRLMDDEQVKRLFDELISNGVLVGNIIEAVNFCKNLTAAEAEEYDKNNDLIQRFNLYPQMRRQSIPIILCNENAKIPVYATPNSAGADLYSANEQGIVVRKGDIKLIPTGIKMELPPDAEAQVRPRSGLSLKEGLVAIFGTIDSDYQGEVGIILSNIGGEDRVIYKGERLAQLVFNGSRGLFQAEFHQVEEFNRSSERGAGGFGSTGNKEVKK